MIDDDNDNEKEASKNHWEDLLRKMLPAGAPFPDEDQLDFSISVQYQQPPTDHHSLSTPIIKNSPFTKPQKFPQNNHKFSNLTSSSVISCQDEEDVDDIVSFDTTQQEEEDEEIHNYVTETITNCEEKNKKKKKKNICSRCGKGNRLREKEICIVCDARYCRNCVLKSMGSMPEGRKCVGCIGQPIRESRRLKLGKCSRMLSKLCSPLEIRQIMIAEKECSANQLRPEQLLVNGRQLQQEDLVELLNCPIPPFKLKPGRYWYDKDSGLWGQEGEKPDRIISSKLNVGGKLQVDASNGNTQVYINGRQITKVELRVLKLAKVQCPQGTHFWLYDDGSYEEEGQNNIKGNIWGKASTRFICSLFCLPVPHEHSTTFVTQNLDHARLQKIMLFGLEGSGTSTIFKQVRFLYGEKLSPEEVQNLKLTIQSNMYRYLSVLLEARERFEEASFSNDSIQGMKMNIHKRLHFSNGTFTPAGSSQLDKKSVYSLNPKFKHFSDWLLDILTTGDFDNYFPAATREYAPLVSEIWKDPAIQQTYKRREELQSLPDVSKYFLDRAIELSSNDYEPSEKDILYAQGVTPTNGLSYLDFSFNDHSPMSDEDGSSSLLEYQLIRMSTKGKLYDGCKWLDMFEDARIVVFCVSLSDYDQMWSPHDDIMENKMISCRDSFESLARQRCFTDIPFMLILNKYDAFEEKIGRTPLTVCEWFNGFAPLKVQHNNQSLANQAYYYVGMKFKELYGSITGRKLFVFQSNGRERKSVEEGLKYMREVIRWYEEKEEDVYGINMNGDDDSFYNTQIDSR